MIGANGWTPVFIVKHSSIPDRVADKRAGNEAEIKNPAPEFGTGRRTIP
jgi:hypothetical protein